LCAFKTIATFGETAIIAFIYVGIVRVYAAVTKGRYGLANRRIRPLCHLSNLLIQTHLHVNKRFSAGKTHKHANVPNGSIFIEQSTETVKSAFRRIWELAETSASGPNVVARIGPQQSGVLWGGRGQKASVGVGNCLGRII
jgi:hypothetical protein